jgi:hypothetical protein
MITAWSIRLGPAYIAHQVAFKMRRDHRRH